MGPIWWLRLCNRTITTTCTSRIHRLAEFQKGVTQCTIRVLPNKFLSNRNNSLIYVCLFISRTTLKRYLFFCLKGSQKHIQRGLRKIQGISKLRARENKIKFWSLWN